MPKRIKVGLQSILNADTIENAFEKMTNDSVLEDLDEKDRETLKGMFFLGFAVACFCDDEKFEQWGERVKLRIKQYADQNRTKEK
jgi:hypothetical protein